MAAVNVAVALTLMPVSLCLGFTAATISFTAWNITVPLLLNGFGLDLAPTLFISVMLDVFNCAALTVMYGYHGKVDWRLGLTFGVISAGAAAIVSNVMVDFLEEHQEYLKGVMYVVPFVLAVGFLAKGVIVWRRRRLQGAASSATAVEGDDSTAAFAMQDINDNGDEEEGAAGPDKAVVDATAGPAPPLRVEIKRTGSSGSKSVLRTLEALSPRFVRKPERAGYEPLLAGASGEGSEGNDDADSQDDMREGASVNASEPGAPRPLSSTTAAGAGAGAGALRSPRSSLSNMSEPAPAPTVASEDGTTGRTSPSSPAGATGADGVPSRDGPPQPVMDASQRRTSVASLIHEAATVITLPPLEKQHAPFWSTPRRPPIMPTTTSRWEQIKLHFMPDEDLLKRRLSKRPVRMGLMAVFAAIMGSLSGALYVGGGMGFALAIASFFKANVRLATGTGCFICFMTMLALSFSFIRDEVELSTSATAAYFFASVPMGVLGSLLGVRLSLRISDTAIFFFIGSVLIIIGIVLVVQSSLQT